MKHKIVAEYVEASDIYARAIEAVNAKRVSHALGLSLSHTYRLARPTMDIDPDGTGARSDLDRIEALADLLAARPEGHPVLIEMREWFDRLFDRVLGAWGGDRLTRDVFHRHLGTAVKEVGEAIAKCQADVLESPEQRKALKRELQEAVVALECLSRALDEDPEPVRKIG